MKKIDKQSEFLRFSRTDFFYGVNLIGYIRGEIGLGQSCRLVAESLHAAEIPFTVFNYEQVSAMRFNDNTWEHKITNTTPFSINIFHINPYEMPLAFLRIGKNVWNKRYNIAFWLWELEKFPKEWENAFFLADEIWTPSEFASQSIRNATSKPVRTIPYALTAPPCGNYDRKYFNLPADKILFLCMYDCNSTIERKNPLGVVSAYKKAFSKKNNQAGLVIKINNPQREDLRLIKSELDGYPNIFILSDVLDKTQVNALISCVDVYVSLHRAEGFGLVPAEAMLLGTPVIATNWSANAEFMDNEVACMVDYTLITIQQDYAHYKAGNRWADPDINQAAEYMKKLCNNENFRNHIAVQAEKHIKKLFAPERIADLIRHRISEIYDGVPLS
jgi:glycosyltransferase involved in cell wall biosynthesis